MTEYLLAEKPCVDELVAMGWQWLRPKDSELARDGLNQVILRDEFIAAIQRINSIDEETARAVYSDMLHIRDNEEWTKVQRGDYSRTVPDQRDKKTIHLIDFKNPANNRFTVTNQLYVQAEKSRIPDVVLYINGIPVVVIEAKSPLAGKDKSGEAFEQIKQYERDIPRLFYSNLFNIVTDGIQFLYGATGALSQYWGVWKDAWPKKDADLSNSLAKGLYCLCEPSRLLDLLAHFVVFEKDSETGAVVKKIARYQQYRAVNKIFDRAQGNKGRRGLIWHTQGSGTLRDELRDAYMGLKPYLHGIKPEDGATKLGLKKEYDALVQALGAEDAWYDFRRKAKVFIRAYEALSPDPSVLEYTRLLRWIAGFIQYGTQAFEQKESIELGEYSSKIRDMLRMHLDVTGISTICKIRNITDPEFWDDFKVDKKPEEEIKTAAIRKGTELKKVLAEKMAENPLRYAPFSARILDVLKRFQQGQLDAAKALKEFENIANELNAEEQSYKCSGLDQRAYGLLKLLEALVTEAGIDTLEKLAQEIDALYASNQSAPKGWQQREQLRKELRQEVRLLAHGSGLSIFKELPLPVEEYALKHYSKVD